MAEVRFRDFERNLPINFTQNGMVFKHWHIPPCYRKRSIHRITVVVITETRFLASCELSAQERFFKVSNAFFWKHKQRVVTKHVLHQHYVHFVDQRPYSSWYKLERRVQTRSYCSLCEELWNVSVTKPRCFISECRINKRFLSASAAYRGVLLKLLVWFCSRPT